MLRPKQVRRYGSALDHWGSRKGLARGVRQLLVGLRERGEQRAGAIGKPPLTAGARPGRGGSMGDAGAEP